VHPGRRAFYRAFRLAARHQGIFHSDCPALYNFLFKRLLRYTKWRLGREVLSGALSGPRPKRPPPWKRKPARAPPNFRLTNGCRNPLLPEPCPGFRFFVCKKRKREAVRCTVSPNSPSGPNGP
jgi:hypothetical protein